MTQARFYTTRSHISYAGHRWVYFGPHRMVVAATTGNLEAERRLTESEHRMTYPTFIISNMMLKTIL